MKDHLGVIRRRVDKLEKEMRALELENIKLKSAGRYLAEYLVLLANGGTARAQDKLRITEAIKMLGRFR